MIATVALPLRIGVRTVWRLKRRLVQIPLTLEEGLRAVLPVLPPLPHGADGYLINGLPAALLPRLKQARAELRPFIRQAYRRSYASLEGDFASYLGRFSSKGRSTLRRKLRKFAERSGGTIDIRCYRAPGEVDEFYRLARTVSSKTYQERRLDAGLPQGEEAREWMRELAARDAMRGWILFLEGTPISYLLAPAVGQALVYAYLGYDPAQADHSPGTILQLEAMRELMEEGHFRLFDFTEGDGQHKRQFGPNGLDCVDVLLVRPTTANLIVGHALGAFDGFVAFSQKMLRRLGLEKLARRILR